MKKSYLKHFLNSVANAPSLLLKYNICLISIYLIINHASATGHIRGIVWCELNRIVGKLINSKDNQSLQKSEI